MMKYTEREVSLLRTASRMIESEKVMDRPFYMKDLDASIERRFVDYVAQGVDATKTYDDACSVVAARQERQLSGR